MSVPTSLNRRRTGVIWERAEEGWVSVLTHVFESLMDMQQASNKLEIDLLGDLLIGFVLRTLKLTAASSGGDVALWWMG